MTKKRKEGDCDCGERKGIENGCLLLRVIDLSGVGLGWTR